MNPVLGIDTSGPEGSVALLPPTAGGGLDGKEDVFTEGMIHGVALAPAVAGLLDRARLRPGDLGLVAVGTGPGSYTGVRVGVAFAKSLAFAARVPLLGVPSLDAIAAGAPRDRDVVVVRDARRGSLYFGLYRRGRTDDDPEGGIRLVSLADARREIPPGSLVIGDATARFADLLSGEERELGEPRLSRASAVEVARIGARRLPGSGPTPPHDLAPVYLRPSEAEERRREEEGRP